MHYRLLVLSTLLPAALHASAAVECPDGNLLAHARLHQDAAVLHPHRLTDGVLAAEGDPWDTDQSAVIPPNQTLSFDLRRAVRVSALLLQGNHPEGYTVSVSMDGAAWYPIWRAPSASRHGMRLRETIGLDGVARWIRLEPQRLQRAYALSEFQAYCRPPERWPPALSRATGMLDPSLKLSSRGHFRQLASHRMTVALLGWLVFVALVVRKARASPVALTCAFALSILAAAYLLLTGLSHRYQPERWLKVGAVLACAVLPLVLIAVHLWLGRRPGRHGSLPAAAALIAGAGALLYGVAIVALYGSPHPATGWALAGLFSVAGAVLALRRSMSWQRRLHGLALVGVTLGSLCALVQFNPQGMLVLLHDQFHYFVGAKYFQELGYTRLYHCAAIAEMDNGRGEAMVRQRIRDLATNRLMPAEKVLADPQPCRRAFSAQRWQAFRADVAYFRTRTTAHGAQGYLMDHGYNASPWWTALNRPMLVSRPASDTAVRWLSSVDIVLLLAMFGLLSWAFGVEVAVLTALLWGTSSIWMYEAQGGIGSFGRLYWVFAVLAAVCLSRKGRFGAAGFCLAVAIMDRLFPVAFVFGPAVVAAVDLFKVRFDGRLWRMLAGATLGVALLASYTLHAPDGLQTAGEFVQNSRKHASTELTNNVGLKTLVSYSWVRIGELSNYQWTQLRKQNLSRRYPVFLALAAGALLLTGWVCWVVREPWKLVVAGLLPMFAVFTLTNYYYAVLILLAPLAAGRLMHIAVLLGTILVGQVLYQQTWPELEYTLYSAMILVVLVYFLTALVLDSKRAGGAPETDRFAPSIAGIA
jgi:hypothetical protein